MRVPFPSPYRTIEDWARRLPPPVLGREYGFRAVLIGLKWGGLMGNVRRWRGNRPVPPIRVLPLGAKREETLTVRWPGGLVFGSEVSA